MKKRILRISMTAIVMMLSFSNVAMASETKEESLNKAVKIEENLKGKSTETKFADDDKLEISLEDYLEVKDKVKGFSEEKMTPKKSTVTPNGVTINETNFKWAGSLDLTNTPKKMIMHHIDASRPGSTIPVTDIHNWHLANGWSGIGYHFYVTKTGQVFRGRPEEAIGAHASGYNVDTIGIAVEGKYQTENMPEAQRKAVIKLGQYVRSKYGMNEILRHKDVNSTSCPGKNYPLDLIKKEINSYEHGNFNKLVYRTHVQDKGWQEFKMDGQTSGSVGEGKRLEGIRIKLNGAIPNGNIKYRTHIEDIGWQDWKRNGELSGTEGQAKRLEAIEIQLENTGKYDVAYRTHVEDIGWQDWKRSGETSGTEGQGKRLEAIEIKIVEKLPAKVEYKTHVEIDGWQNWKSNGELSGTVSQAKRLEGIQIKTQNLPANASIVYRTHIENIGWQDWKRNGEFSGTEGQAKRLEGIEIKLENAPGYRVEYRTHVEDIGWQGWKKNGEMSGTEGQAKRLEAIEIKVVKN
ncbi:N-acetylmuramoyl-L-alanine amidase [uncultured Clostridium sp.]|uniref:N-acetylmuramoyl-L-alanine amidase n=1 Tax=uncultured Clostridium sp. TaxID=59620 RepID=UPI002609469F|nr:N-acetylmuramoyl-L-alanine amidase [uncultured Clostridium sp.]